MKRLVCLALLVGLLGCQVAWEVGTGDQPHKLSLTAGLTTEEGVAATLAIIERMRLPSETEETR